MSNNVPLTLKKLIQEFKTTGKYGYDLVREFREFVENRIKYSLPSVINLILEQLNKNTQEYLRTIECMQEETVLYYRNLAATEQDSTIKNEEEQQQKLKKDNLTSKWIKDVCLNISILRNNDLWPIFKLNVCIFGSKKLPLMDGFDYSFLSTLLVERGVSHENNVNAWFYIQDLLRKNENYSIGDLDINFYLTESQMREVSRRIAFENSVFSNFPTKDDLYSVTPAVQVASLMTTPFETNDVHKGINEIAKLLMECNLDLINANPEGTIASFLEKLICGIFHNASLDLVSTLVERLDQLFLYVLPVFCDEYQKKYKESLPLFQVTLRLITELSILKNHNARQIIHSWLQNEGFPNLIQLFDEYHNYFPERKLDGIYQSFKRAYILYLSNKDMMDNTGFINIAYKVFSDRKRSIHFSTDCTVNFNYDSIQLISSTITYIMDYIETIKTDSEIQPLKSSNLVLFTDEMRLRTACNLFGNIMLRNPSYDHFDKSVQERIFLLVVYIKLNVANESSIDIKPLFLQLNKTAQENLRNKFFFGRLPHPETVMNKHFKLPGIGEDPCGILRLYHEDPSFKSLKEFFLQQEFLSPSRVPNEAEGKLDREAENVSLIVGSDLPPIAARGEVVSRQGTKRNRYDFYGSMLKILQPFSTLPEVPEFVIDTLSYYFQILKNPTAFVDGYHKNPSVSPFNSFMLDVNWQFANVARMCSVPVRGTTFTDRSARAVLQHRASSSLVQETIIDPTVLCRIIGFPSKAGQVITR